MDAMVAVARKELAWETDYIREAQCQNKFKSASVCTLPTINLQCNYLTHYSPINLYKFVCLLVPSIPDFHTPILPHSHTVVYMYVLPSLYIWVLSLHCTSAPMYCFPNHIHPYPHTAKLPCTHSESSWRTTQGS